MKYCIVGAPQTVDRALATATLFDLLGDPSLWSESHEIVFFNYDGENLDSWAQEIFDVIDVPVVTDFDTLEKGWVVLGPTDEDLVKEATKVGATYLALDDGLMELEIVPDEPEVEVVPDIPSDVGQEGDHSDGPEHMDIPKEEEPPVAEVLPEVPAVPKRRAPRKKAAPKVVEEANPEFEKAVDEALKVAEPVTLSKEMMEPETLPVTQAIVEKAITVDSIREKGKVGFRDSGTTAAAAAKAETRDEKGRLPVSTDVYMEAHLEGYVDGMVEAERIADKAKDVVIETTITESVRPEGYVTYNFGDPAWRPQRGIDAILRDLIGVMLEMADEDQLWQIAASVRGVIK
jgi:hypothetical protein